MVDDDRHGGGEHLEALRRWELAGGTWRVVAESAAGLTVSLRTCATDEEMDRFTTADSAVVAYVRAAGGDGEDDPDSSEP